ncbi:hypothetical protein, partial [Endozoicomonas sp. SESOKO2]|uniref:hypothetical protein n=1 Tax=Endozoicomonas sp. SESOKO2 TaxID=2828743 RepID=UPI0021480511
MQKNKRNSSRSKKNWRPERKNAGKEKNRDRRPNGRKSRPRRPQPQRKNHPPPAPKPYDLAGTLNEATEAFARKEPVGVLNNIFKRVINHPQVTGFDKAQAHYSYADMVTSRLRRQLEFVHKMIEPVYAYGQALENQGPPDLEKDIKFREALKQFKLNMQQISIYTLVMSKAVKEAQEIFFSLNEDQPEFVDALVDLHNDMEHLIAQGKAVIQCCKDIPDIYARRGKMIQRHKLYRKSGSLRDHELKSGSQQHRDLQSDSERHRELSDRIKDLEELGKKLDKSMGMLKDALNSEQAAQVRQALSPDDSASVAECNNDSAQGSLPDQATSSMQTSPVATAAPSEGTHTTDIETPLVAGIEEAQEIKLPLKLLIPENMVIALGISIVERQLIALMKLFDSGTVQDKNLTTAKSRKGKKGKQQGRKGKDPVVPQPQATEVKKKNVDPDELGLKLQTRLSDYLEVLHDTGKTPDGKTVPEGLDLKVLLTRIQQGTFLEDSKYLGVDCTFLSDALKIPIQVNLPMNNMLYFRP